MPDSVFKKFIVSIIIGLVCFMVGIVSLVLYRDNKMFFLSIVITAGMLTKGSLIYFQFKKGNFVKGISTFDKEIIYTLRKMSTDEISDLPDVSEGLEFALKNAANQCNSVIELLSIIKTKRYTQTRLQRILLYAILGIDKEDMDISISTSPYIRVLGFNDKGQELLSEISKKNKKLEVITSVKKFMDKKGNENLKLLMDKDIWATDVYTLGFDYESKANLDYTHKLIT